MYQKPVLVRSINLLNEILDDKDELPKAVVVELFKCRKALRWHLTHSTGSKPRKRASKRL